MPVNGVPVGGFKIRALTVRGYLVVTGLEVLATSGQILVSANGWWFMLRATGPAGARGRPKRAVGSDQRERS